MEHVQLYRDQDQKYRWRYLSHNGRIVADSGQGYRRKIDCLHGLSLVTGRSVLGLNDGDFTLVSMKSVSNPVPIEVLR